MAKSNAQRQRDYRERLKNGQVAKHPSPVINAKSLFQLVSVIRSRAEYASRLGQSFGGKRDIYDALGYAKSLEFNDFNAKYERGDIAKKIVNLPAAATWRKKPNITEGQRDPTRFETDWQALVKERKIYHYLSRLDRIVGIGQYGVLLLGFDDGADFMQEVTKAGRLLYLQPYSETNAKIKTWEEDQGDERYGQPKTYSITLASANKLSKASVAVHHSRVIHVAEGTTENDIYGTPRLKAVFNRLQNLELVIGGSAEMFWRGAFPGYAFKEQKDYELDTQAMSDLQDELELYMHDLQRYLRLKGVDLEELAMQVASPKDHVEVILDLISGATDIPKRILIGSERGELASSQDEKNWATRIDERRKDFAEPMILRPLIDRLIRLEVIARPRNDSYSVEWPPIVVPSEKDEAEVGKAKAEALNKYVSGIGAEQILPPELFLRLILGLDEDQIKEAEELLEGMARGEER